VEIKKDIQRISTSKLLRWLVGLLLNSYTDDMFMKLSLITLLCTSLEKFLAATTKKFWVIAVSFCFSNKAHLLDF
jgi:hypothetical protein